MRRESIVKLLVYDAEYDAIGRIDKEVGCTVLRLVWVK
jgi:hypothetical protein